MIKPKISLLSKLKELTALLEKKSPDSKDEKQTECLTRDCIIRLKQLIKEE